ncbi:MAG: hypothetical protein ACFB9N_02095 [Geitlerinemataceae cyanobacterium]
MVIGAGAGLLGEEDATEDFAFRDDSGEVFEVGGVGVVAGDEVFVGAELDAIDAEAGGRRRQEVGGEGAIVEEDLAVADFDDLAGFGEDVAIGDAVGEAAGTGRLRR